MGSDVSSISDNKGLQFLNHYLFSTIANLSKFILIFILLTILFNSNRYVLINTPS